jgi:hypothetical protein
MALEAATRACSAYSPYPYEVLKQEEYGNWLTNTTTTARAGAHRCLAGRRGWANRSTLSTASGSKFTWRELAGARPACSRRAAGFDEVWTALRIELQLKRVKAADVRKQIK